MARRIPLTHVALDALKAIPGFPGYYATKDAHVFLLKELSPAEHSDGYLRVQTIDSGAERRRLGLHQAVCRAFHGEPPNPRSEVRHLDGNKRRNVPENLAWGSRRQNAGDMARHGTMKGTRNPKSRLSEADVRAIRASTDTNRQLAKKYGVCWSTISHARTGRNWSHVR